MLALTHIKTSPKRWHEEPVEFDRLPVVGEYIAMDSQEDGLGFAPCWRRPNGKSFKSSC